MMYLPTYGICPVCSKRKGVASHKKCSRILQKQRNHEEWDKLLNNQHKEENQQIAIKASTQRVRRINYFQGYQK